MIIPPRRLSTGHDVGLMKLCRISAAKITVELHDQTRMGYVIVARHVTLFAATRDPPAYVSISEKRSKIGVRNKISIPCDNVVMRYVMTNFSIRIFERILMWHDNVVV